MKFNLQKIYHGPNIYASVPLVVNKIDLEHGSIKRLIPLIQQMKNNYIKNNYPETKVILEESIYLINLMGEFILQLINDNNGILDIVNVFEEDGNIICCIEFESLEVTIRAIESAVSILYLLYKNEKDSKNKIENILDNFAKYAKYYLNYDKQLLCKAHELDIPSFQNSSNNYLFRQYGWGEKSRVFRQFSPMEDGYHGVNVSMDKLESKKLLKSLGVPVANHVIITQKEELKNAVNTIGYPCVIKPTQGSEGVGITANIQNFAQLEKAYIKVKKTQYGNNFIMLEEFIEGVDNRLVVIDGKFIGAFERLATTITGDGTSTVKQLIEVINEERNDLSKNRWLLETVNYDSELLDHLQTYDLTLESIIEKNKKIPLNSVSNCSAGGDLGKVIHNVPEEIKQIAQTIAKVTHIDILGIDYISKDITKPYSFGHGAITEFNHYLDFDLLNLVKTSLNTLEQCGRIPVQLLIITKNEMIKVEKYLKQNIDEYTGWCNQHKAFLGTLPLRIYNNKGWEIVKSLLRHQTLKKIIIVASFDEIKNIGLPLDRFDTIYYSEIDNDWLSVLEKTTNKLKKFDQDMINFGK